MIMNSMSLIDYWNHHKSDIAEKRGWKAAVLRGKSILDAYSSKMEQMARLFPETFVNKSFTKVSLRELLAIVDNMRKSDNSRYAQASKVSYLVVLHDLFWFANNSGHAVDPFACLQSRGSRGSSSKLGEIRQVVEKIGRGDFSRNESIDKLRSVLQHKRIRRSMSPVEIQRFLRLVQNGIRDDGRYLGLALIFYLGSRPGETRALRWEDIIYWQDGRRFYCISDALGVSTDANGKTKTDNGFRKVPEHCELRALVDERYEFITAQTGQEPTGYICCPGNDFGKPCTYYDFASFADKQVFSMLDSDYKCGMAAEFMLAQLTDTHDRDCEDTLTLYCLRHTFYTWLATSTPLSEMERAYLMGHEMIDNNRDIRSRFNDNDLLARIGDDMDRFVCLPDYHPDKRITLGPDGVGNVHAVGDTGIQEYYLSLSKGDTAEIEIELSSDHAGTETVLKALSPIKGNLDVQVSLEQIINLGEPDRRPRRVSSDCDRWLYLTQGYVK